MIGRPVSQAKLDEIGNLDNSPGIPAGIIPTPRRSGIFPAGRTRGVRHFANVMGSGLQRRASPAGRDSPRRNRHIGQLAPGRGSGNLHV